MKFAASVVSFACLVGGLSATSAAAVLPPAISTAERSPSSCDDAADKAAILSRIRTLHHERKWKELLQEFAEMDFTSWPAALPGQAGEALYLRGQARAFTKDGQRAKTDLRAALELTPANAVVWLALADNALNNLNDDEQAIAAYRQVIILAGTNRQGWQPLTATVGLARIYTDQVKCDKALEVLQPYGDLREVAVSWRIKLLRSYGHIFAAQGREEESLAKFREALQLEAAP